MSRKYNKVFTKANVAELIRTGNMKELARICGVQEEAVASRPRIAAPEPVTPEPASMEAIVAAVVAQMNRGAAPTPAPVASEPRKRGRRSQRVAVNPACVGVTFTRSERNELNVDVTFLDSSGNRVDPGTNVTEVLKAHGMRYARTLQRWYGAETVARAAAAAAGLEFSLS